jgi:hypothetical protein
MGRFGYLRQCHRDPRHDEEVVRGLQAANELAESVTVTTRLSASVDGAQVEALREAEAVHDVAAEAVTAIIRAVGPLIAAARMITAGEGDARTLRTRVPHRHLLVTNAVGALGRAHMVDEGVAAIATVGVGVAATVGAGVQAGAMAMGVTAAIANRPK